MTLWLSNLAAYSVQFAVLVGTAAAITAILRVDLPRAALRFWQGVFAASLLWPVWQLWASGDASALASPGLFGAVFSNSAPAAVSASAAMLSGLASMDLASRA